MFLGNCSLKVSATSFPLTSSKDSANQKELERILKRGQILQIDLKAQLGVLHEIIVVDRHTFKLPQPTSH